MFNSTSRNADNTFQATPALQELLATFKQRNPQHDFMPPFELVTSHPPDGYEAFFNQVAELVSWQLQDDKCDNAYLMKIMHELFRFRNAFREMRGGEEW
jgi:hypothetical protein